MISVKQAVILAGGRGTRLKPLTDTVPKPMILMNGKPFLEYLIEMLKENGIHEIVLLLGYLPEKIIEYFGDGERFGVKIKYSISDVSDETGTRIKKAEKVLQNYFLLMYCDNYFPLNLKKLLEFHERQNTFASVLVYTNKDKITKNNIFVDEKGFVITYDPARKQQNLNGVDLGFFILNKKIMEWMPKKDFSFQNIIIPKLIKEQQLSGHLVNHRYYSIGSLERLPITEKFLQHKKVIFLDRDGVINKKAPKADYIKSWNEFEFLPGVLQGIQLLKENDYHIFIISNQAGIAREIMTEENLAKIHKNMISEIEKNGGKIDGIYYCPHGWNENCDCRKPKPGMFFKASREHHIDLSKSFFIGDDERDKTAGEAAGIKTILVDPDNNFMNALKIIPNLKIRKDDKYEELINKIIKKYRQFKNDRFFLSIAGCSRSGKTTLAKKIQKDLENKGIKSKIISLDNWLLGIDERKGNETVRERFQYKKISEDLTKLKNGEKIYTRVYDPKSRKITSDKSSKPLQLKKEEIGIIDGIVSLDIITLRDISDYKIFVDLDDETRKERLVDFYTNFKNYDLGEAERIINPRENDEVEIIKKNKNHADVIYVSEKNR
jgi:D-glycero-D-manno-heptose 1,7-bisphosphate phosphatase